MFFDKFATKNSSFLLVMEIVLFSTMAFISVAFK